SSHDFALVGGGIVGACLADELARGGATVVVLDAGAEPGHATPLAAGVAVPSLRYVADRAFHGWLTAARSALEDDLRELELRRGRFTTGCPSARLLQEADLELLPADLDSDVVGDARSAAELESQAPGLRLPADCRPFQAANGLVVDGAAYLRAVRAAAE